MRRVPLIVLGAFVVSASGCADPTPPRTEPIPEPTEALRPESVRGPIPADARVADYEIEAYLDEEEHVINGKLRLTWHNRTRREVRRLPFHLYINGFRAEDTAWMREARGEFRGVKLDPDAMGYVDLERVSGHSASEVAALEGKAGVELAWHEFRDPSLMVVDLKEPVGPGGVAQIEIDFVTKMPKVFARTGYAGDFHMAGQWFPKLGVLEEEAGWQAHVFTPWSEFYADFGNYDVTLDVPADFVVGATGIRTDEKVEGERKRLTYHAEMVHDFAWTADPEFVEHWGEYDGIRIRQLMHERDLKTADDHMEAQLWTLKSMEARFGTYPWSTITIVHPPIEGQGAMGMEYPTLYTTSPREDLPAALIEERFNGIFTTVHEFGHQYFQGLFASNEHDQPWMDEGLNTFSNFLAYEDNYGPDPWLFKFFGHPMSMYDGARLGSVGTEYDIIDKPASAFPAQGSAYFSVSYNKAAMVFTTLRNLVGHEAFDEAMAEFTARARFGHPTGDQFEGVMAEVLGEEVEILADAEHPITISLADFFEQGLRSTADVDFQVASVNNRRRAGERGYQRHEHDGKSELHRHYVGPDGSLSHEKPEDEAEKKAEGKLSAEESEGVVLVVRRGEFRLPVEVLVEFEDDTEQLIVWDGQARYRKLTFDQKRVRRAVVDPANKLLLERNRLDNALYARGSDVGNGLSPAARRLTEGLSLAIFGGFAP